MGKKNKKKSSPSSWWRSYFDRGDGGYSSWGWGSYSSGLSAEEREQKERKRRADKVLADLSRTVNIVQNSEEGKKEKSLKVQWGQAGSQNDCRTNTVYLDPDFILQRPKEEDIENTDALTGEALLLSTMKRTMSPVAQRQALHAHIRVKEDPLAFATNVVWEAKENVVAREDVLQDWMGFEGYFDCYSEKIFVDQEAIQEYVDNHDMDIKLASVVLSWNMQNPDSPIELPEQYQKLFDKATAELLKEVPQADRWTHGNAVCTALERYLKRLESMKPQGSDGKAGEGDEGMEADGEGSESEEGNPSQKATGRHAGREQKKKEQPKKKQGANKDNKEGQDKQKEGKGASGKQGKNGDAADLIRRMLSDQKTNQHSIQGDADQDQVDPREESDHPDDLLDYSHAGDTKPLEGIQIQKVGKASDPAAYQALLRELSPQIKRVANVLNFRDVQKTQWTHGCRDGELDEGSLYKLSDPKIETIWSKKEKLRKPDVAVCILVDESGSMQSPSRGAYHGTSGYSRTKAQEARRVAIILAEALRTVPGIKIRVLGHTANIDLNRYGYRPTRSGECRKVGKVIELNMREFVTDQKGDFSSLYNIEGMGNNIDGYALEYAAKDLAKAHPEARHRFVFHISDGQPAGHSYHGANAQEHMLDVVTKMSKKGIAEIFAIGVENAYSREHGEAMYGPHRNVVIEDTGTSLNIITAFLRQVLRRV